MLGGTEPPSNRLGSDSLSIGLWWFNSTSYIIENVGSPAVLRRRSIKPLTEGADWFITPHDAQAGGTIGMVTQKIMIHKTR